MKKILGLLLVVFLITACMDPAQYFPDEWGELPDIGDMEYGIAVLHIVNLSPHDIESITISKFSGGMPITISRYDTQKAFGDWPIDKRNAGIVLLVGNKDFRLDNADDIFTIKINSETYDGDLPLLDYNRSFANSIVKIIIDWEDGGAGQIVIPPDTEYFGMGVIQIINNSKHTVTDYRVISGVEKDFDRITNIPVDPGEVNGVLVLFGKNETNNIEPGEEFEIVLILDGTLEYHHNKFEVLYNNIVVVVLEDEDDNNGGDTGTGTITDPDDKGDGGGGFTGANFFMSQNTLIDTGVVIRNDGLVWIWGFRGSGQAGNGANRSNLTPPQPITVPSGMVLPITRVTGSAYIVAALDSAGQVWSWGDNLNGMGSRNANRIQNIPIKADIPDSETIVQIDAGEYFFIALSENGRVYTWGQNVFGQIGNGTTNSTGRNAIPTDITSQFGNNRVVRIGASYEGAYAITDDLSVWAWGDHRGSIASTWRQLSPTRVPQLSLILAAEVPINGDFQISGGYRQGHLLVNGNVYSWGTNNRIGRGNNSNISGPAKVPFSDNGRIVQMHSRFVATTVLTDDGKVWSWGLHGDGMYHPITRTGDPVLWGNGVENIGGGKEHVFYRDSSGTLRGVGYGAARKFVSGTGNQRWPGRSFNL